MKVLANERGIGLPILIIGAIVVVACVGFVAYRTYKIQKDNSKSNVVVKESKKQTATDNTQTTTKTPESEVNNNEAIIAAAKSYNEKNNAGTTYTSYSVSQKDGNFAHVTFGDDFGGANMYLKYQDGWKVVIAGVQNIPPQCLGKYGFPASWYSSTPTGYENICLAN